MHLILALLAVALQLPEPWYPPGEAHETQAERRDRIEMITTVIAEESRATALPWPADGVATVTLVMLDAESWHFRRDVHSGERKGDGGKAICLGQAHRAPLLTRAEWLGLAGLDHQSTRRCVRHTLRVFELHAKRCGVTRWARRDVAKVIAGYGTGYSCSPSLLFAKKRARRSFRVLEKLRLVGM